MAWQNTRNIIIIIVVVVAGPLVDQLQQLARTTRTTHYNQEFSPFDSESGSIRLQTVSCDIYSTDSKLWSGSGVSAAITCTCLIDRDEALDTSDSFDNCTQ